MADKGSIDDKARNDELTATRRQNLVAMCIRTGIFYHPEKHTCAVTYPCDYRVPIKGSEDCTCSFYNKDLNPDAKQV